MGTTINPPDYKRKVIIPKNVLKSDYEGMLSFFESHFKDNPFHQEIINSNSPVFVYGLLHQHVYMSAGVMNLIVVDDNLRFKKNGAITDKTVYRLLFEDDLIQNLIMLGMSKNVNNDNITTVEGSELLPLIKEGKGLLRDEIGKRSYYGIMINVSMFGKRVRIPSFHEISAFFTQVHDSSFVILFDENLADGRENSIIEGFNQTYRVFYNISY
ncbi:hypothetical protein J7J90_00025 [Candidatus Micrarchaeota archaeon]|nr:hypothetical protein [Candidatus Micrarchaeota archaeon]